MDLLRKNKALSAGIIVLVLLNIATLGTLWWQSGRQAPPGPPRWNPGEFMAQQLRLSSEQASQFDERRRTYQREYEPLVSRLRSVRRDLYKDLRSGDTASAVIVPKSDEIGGLQARIEILRIRHFQGLRMLCDDRQQKIFDGIMHDVFESGPSQPPSSPGGPAEGPPPSPGDVPPGGAASC